MPNYTTSRRTFLLAGTALASLGLLPPSYAQEQNLRLFWWGGQARAERTLAVADLYASKTGSEPFASEFLSWGDYWLKLATLVAGGSTPDVVQMDYALLTEYASRDAIAPLDEFVGGALNLEDFDQDQIESGKVNGKLYGISLGANSAAMIVNLAAFEEAGLEPPDNSWTYEDIPRLGEAFKKANIRGGMRLISDASGAEPMFENWLRQRGKQLYTAEGKYAVEAEDLAEWFSMWAEFREAGYVVLPEDQALNTGVPESTPLALNKAALFNDNSNQLIIHQSINPDPLTIISYPRIEPGAGGGHYRKPSMLLSIGASSTQKEQAAEFINFFVNDPEAGAILGVERGIPNSAGVRDAVASTLSDQDRISLEYVAGLGDLMGPLPPAPPKGSGEVSLSLMGPVSQEIAFGVRSPEDGARYIVEQAPIILSREN